jgi:hypothetical protein
MQLERFAAVVEEGSVPDAALRAFRTQPAVSIAKSKLEREFETPLLDRSRRHEYCLTPLGEALYHYATRILSLRMETISPMGDKKGQCVRIQQKYREDCCSEGWRFGLNGSKGVPANCPIPETSSWVLSEGKTGSSGVGTETRNRYARTESARYPAEPI